MTGTSLVSYQDRFAKDAAEIAAREARGGLSLSTEGGVFSLGQETLGPKIAVIVLDSWFANEFFIGEYDRGNPLPPVCYAFERDKSKLSPHPSMAADLSYFQPQHFPCEGCAQNEWGSAKQGRGKACKNREKLAVLPAGYFTAPKGRTPGELHLFEEPSHFAKADIVTLGVSVTSGENWSKYVSQLAVAHRRPPYAVYTEITLAPDPKSQYKMHFDMIELAPETLFETLVARVDEQLARPFQGYQAPAPEQRIGAPQPVRSAAQGLRGMRR